MHSPSEQGWVGAWAWGPPHTAAMHSGNTPDWEGPALHPDLPRTSRLCQGHQPTSGLASSALHPSRPKAGLPLQ